MLSLSAFTRRLSSRELKENIRAIRGHTSSKKGFPKTIDREKDCCQRKIERKRKRKRDTESAKKA